MRVLRILVIFCVATAVLFGTAAHADSIRWRVFRTRHFLVHYAGERRPIAERAAAIAEEWRGTLSRRLTFGLQGVTNIYLYPDRRTFSDATGVEAADPIVGIAHTRLLSIKIDSSGAFEDISRIIPHELVHIFISSRLRGRTSELPVWMHEGLAKYMSTDWSPQDAELLSDAASGGEIIPLKRISLAFPRDEKQRAIAYVESYSAVKYMAEKYGADSITHLFSEMEAGQPFRKALLYSIASGPEEFEAEWQQYLWEKHQLNRWLKFGSAAIPVAMALFAILAFRARRIQKQRKSQEFEDENAPVE